MCIVVLTLISALGVYDPNTAATGSTEMPAWADVSLELLRDGSAAIAISFHRHNYRQSQLLLTALKLSGRPSASTIDAVEFIELGGRGGHLTAWFVIEGRGRELWLGVQLDVGVRTETVRIKIPGVLRKRQIAQDYYELIVDVPESALENLAEASAKCIFAPTREFRVGVPAWLTVTESNGWVRKLGGGDPLYQLPPDWRGKEARVLEFEQSSLLAVWFEHKLIGFSMGVIAGVVVVLLLVELFGEMDNRVRLVVSVCLILLALSLLAIGGWTEMDWRKSAFSGNVLLGSAVGLAVLVLLPRKCIPKVRHVLKQWLK